MRPLHAERHGGQQSRVDWMANMIDPLHLPAPPRHEVLQSAHRVSTIPWGCRQVLCGYVVTDDSVHNLHVQSRNILS